MAGIDPISIASTGIGVIGGIYGAIKAGEERKKMDAYLNQRNADNEAQFNRDYYSDYTNRSDVQNLQRQLRDNLKRENQITTNTAVVTGAPPEAVNAEKERTNQVLTDATSNIAAQGAQWKDRVQDRYLAMKNNLDNQRYGVMENAANSYENLMGNGIKTIGSSLQGMADANMQPGQVRFDGSKGDLINAGIDPSTYMQPINKPLPTISIK